MRKMGFVEKVTTMMNWRAQASCSVAVVIAKVNYRIDFSVFKQAWEVQFKRQPLLRAVCRQERQEYFFDFTAELCRYFK